MGAVVGSVSADDPDSGQTLSYSITAGNTGGAFTIDSTGQITVADNSALDYEANATFSLTVQVTDDGTPSLSDSATVTINLNDLNEAPSIDDASFTLDENSAAGTVVGTVTGSDPDAGQTLAYSITGGNTGGAFAINSTTGQITVANSAALDYEPTPTFSLTVRVVDDGSPSQHADATVTINLNDVNEAPTVPDQSFAVNENSPAGTVVGSVSASDPDVGQTLTYSITGGNTGGAFAIDATTGQFTVASSGTLNYETNPTFSLTVQVSDSGDPSLSDSATITVSLTNVNEPPVIDDQSFSVDEDSATGSVVGTVAASDPDAGQILTYSITAGSTGGAFSINSTTGQITVANSAALDYETSPMFSLTVQVTDNESPSLSDSATVTINLNDVNEAPSIEDASFTLDENSAAGTVVGTVQGTDPDAGQTLSYSITAGNTDNAFAIDPDTGEITVANSAALDYETTPSFFLTVKVTDDGDPSKDASATVTINLNDLTGAVGDRVWLDANGDGIQNPGELGSTGITVRLLDDQGVELATTTTDALGHYAFGDLRAGTYQVEFVAPSGYGFTVQGAGNDTELDSDADQSTGRSSLITLIQGEQRDDLDAGLVANPLPEGDSYSVIHDRSLVIAAPGVLDNDSDPNGLTLTAELAAGPLEGTLSLDGDGGFTYTPDPGFVGTDSFTYRVSNGVLTSDPATVVLLVTNEAPETTDDVYGVHADTPLSVAAPGVLGNDSDADSDTLTVEVVTSPENGTLILNADGSFTYEPDEEFTGTDTFVYNTTDGIVSVSATVTLLVHADNNPPVAADDDYTVHANEILVIDSLFLPLWNDEDADWDVLTAEHLTEPAHGTLTFNADSSFTYEPETGFVGTDSFTYRVTDGLEWSNTATVTIAVTNEVPVAEDDWFTTHAGETLEVLIPGVVANDFDPDEQGSPTVVLIDGPGYGTLQLSSDGSFTYTPDAGFVGIDTFTYQAWDAVAGSEDATVTIEVTDTAPVASEDEYLVGVNNALVDASSVLENDFDEEGDDLTATLVSGPQHADSFTLFADGTFDYTPTPDYTGSDTFTYRASDGTLNSDVTTVTITVTADPVAESDEYVLPETGNLVVDVPEGVLVNDFSPTGTALTAEQMDVPRDELGDERGTLTFSGDGSFTYEPDPGAVGDVHFSYRAWLGAAVSAVVLVMVKAEAPPIPTATLQRVTFSGGKDLLPDTPGQNNQPNAYSGPHWYDKNLNGDINAPDDRQYPYLYVRNTKMVVSAVFKFEAADLEAFKKADKSADGIQVEGMVTSGLNILFVIPKTRAVLSTVLNQFTITNISADLPFADKVAYHPELAIQWSYSLDNWNDWETAGLSKNRVYVTLAAPKTNNLYDTVLYVGTKNADLEKSPEGVLDKVWQGFKDRSVSRVDGTLLKYYGNWETTSIKTATLVKTGDGRCGAWGEFFIDVLRAQGYNVPKTASQDVRPAQRVEAGFFVNDWDFNGKGLLNGVVLPPELRPVSAYPFVNVPQDPVIKNNAFQWLIPGGQAKEDVQDKPGIPGQNSPNPQSIFANHVIVKIGNLYYDPSYGGKPYTGLGDFEANLAGFYADLPVKEPRLGLDLNGDGDKGDQVRIFMTRKNPGDKKNVRATPFNY